MLQYRSASNSLLIRATSAKKLPISRHEQFSGEAVINLLLTQNHELRARAGLMRFTFHTTLWLPDVATAQTVKQLAAQLKKSNSQIDVRIPIARTTHHPARASHIQNAPPKILPVTRSQNIGEERTLNTIMSPRMIPPETKTIPIFKRKALPAAPILQVNAMSYRFCL